MQKKEQLDDIFADLFLVEAEEDETEMALRTRLQEEFLKESTNTGSEEAESGEGEYHGGYDAHGNHVHA